MMNFHDQTISVAVFLCITCSKIVAFDVMYVLFIIFMVLHFHIKKIKLMECNSCLFCWVEATKDAQNTLFYECTESETESLS